MGNLINLLSAISWPAGGLWETIIGWFAGFIHNYGLTIILVTICIKILCLPIDIYQRRASKKTQEQNLKLQPQLNAIKVKYANNAQMQQQKTMELYKKEGINPMKSCSVLLIGMVLTLLIFITLFNAMGNISRVKINYEYLTLQNTYTEVYNEELNARIEASVTIPNANELITIKAEATEEAKKAVATKYEEIREGFLWIKNVWRPDTSASIFPNANEFLSNTNNSFQIITAEGEFKGLVKMTGAETPYYAVCDGTFSDETTFSVGDTFTDVNKAKEAFISNYTTITETLVTQNSGWNGWYILVMLSVLITFFSQFLITAGMKKVDENGNEVKQKNNYLMGIILSVVMLFISLSYTSAFSLYIVVNSLFTLGINLFSRFIKKTPKNKDNDKNISTVEYSRYNIK